MSLNLFVCGPDGVCKTTIAKKMSEELGLPYFKVETEKENWKNETFRHSLKFDALLPQFVRQTSTNFVSDRGYACEFAYARAFGRETDISVLRQIDDEWAKMGVTHVLCFLRDYSLARKDDVVPQEKLIDIEKAYLEFAEWTNTDVIGLYLDEFTHIALGTSQKLPIALRGCDPDPAVEIFNLDAACKEAYAGLEAFKLKKKYPRVYEIIKNGEV